MKIFADSSAFAKRYINEPGSDQIETLLEKATELALCIICIPELLSALNRLRHENKITYNHYRSAKTAFFTDLDDITLCTLTPITIKNSVEIIEHNKIRAMNSLHIASALEWQADLFISADYRQLSAAKNSGLKIITL